MCVYQNKIPILSFYSGGGFMDMGFEQAGFNIIWTNEFDEVFAKLHSAGVTSWRKSKNINNTAEIFNTKSILEISCQEIKSQAFSNTLPLHFGMIGGPPCQDFTINGKMRGFNGDRGKLTIVYFDKIIELKPTFFIMENVMGLTARNESKKFLDGLLENMEEEYLIDYKKLNALNFGVPQSRDRVFFVGIKKSAISSGLLDLKNSNNWFPFPQDLKYKDAFKNEWAKPNGFGMVVSKPKDLPIELCVESCLVSEDKINLIPNANEYFNLWKAENELNLINEGETNRPSFKRLHRYKYSPTACYGNNEVHLHPYRQRRLSVREALRIQGVPDSYVLPKNIPLSKKFKMIGNGVPVPLARAVANSLMEFLVKNKIV